MPADDLYWNPMDLDSDESIPYPKQNIDPWDLENYAYIRQHLDSVDLNSDPSSLGEPQETSAFYYIPTKPAELPRHKHQTYYAKRDEMFRAKEKYDDYYHPTPMKAPSGKYDTLAASEHGTANYVAIDELTVKNGIPGPSGKRRASFVFGNSTGKSRFEPDSIEEYDGEDGNIYESGFKEESMQLYGVEQSTGSRTFIKNPNAKARSSRNRSYSFSVGDYEYESYKPSSQHQQQPFYNGVEDLYVKPDYYDSTGSSPIYDDIKFHRPKPNNFKLSNYGHLQIDYSCSWNNLNKYIYN